MTIFSSLQIMFYLTENTYINRKITFCGLHRHFQALTHHYEVKIKINGKLFSRTMT